MDQGYAETFNYLKFIFVSAVTMYLAFSRKKIVYFVWSIFFLILFADDAFSFHERIGKELVYYFDLPGFLTWRAQDVGANLFLALVGLVVIVPIMYNLLWGKEEAQKITFHYIILTAILLFFGIFVDLMHSAFREVPGSGVLTVAEDWGEMLAASLMVWYTLFLSLLFKKGLGTVRKVPVEKSRSGNKFRRFNKK
jgi:hypothetical protein